MENGVVCSVAPDRGFCFIRPDDGSPNLFAHATAFAPPLVHFGEVYVGMKVEFAREYIARGVRAANVRVVIE